MTAILDSNLPVAHRIRKAIAKTGMTGHAFGMAAGISYPSLRDYLTGRSLPGFDAIRKISTTAHVSCDWLIFGDEPPVKPINEVR